MATIKEDDTFTQIVRFEVEPEQQLPLIQAIATEGERWIRHREGFISSTLHASHDGRQIINYAQWTNEAAFDAFLQDPEADQLKATIRAIDPTLKPKPIQCRVVRSILPT